MIRTVDGLRRQGGLRVLVVDDDQSIRGLLRHLVKRAGHEVETAEDGYQGEQKILEAAEGRHPYDLVFTDIDMPGMSGTEMINEVTGKLNSHAPDFYIVTANAFQEGYRRNAHVRGYLRKPFDVSDVQRALEEPTGQASRAYLKR